MSDVGKKRCRCAARLHNSIRTCPYCGHVFYLFKKIRGTDKPAHFGKLIRGERNGQAKLTADKVREIRRRYVSTLGGTSRRRGEFPDRNSSGALASEFGIHKRTVLSIVSGEAWSWVD